MNGMLQIAKVSRWNLDFYTLMADMERAGCTFAPEFLALDDSAQELSDALAQGWLLEDFIPAVSRDLAAAQAVV